VQEKVIKFLFGCLLFSGLIFLSACGGRRRSCQGHPGTPAGAYTVTVMGTFGSQTHSTMMSFTVH
jgi:hypothetical protein